MVCPLNKDSKAPYECKDCEYRDDCIEDILNEVQALIMERMAEGIAKIRKVVRKHEEKE